MYEAEGFLSLVPSTDELGPHMKARLYIAQSFAVGYRHLFVNATWSYRI